MNGMIEMTSNVCISKFCSIFFLSTNLSMSVGGGGGRKDGEK